MWSKHNRAWSLITLLLLGIVLLVGCVPSQAKPRGWSGGIVAADTLILGSMEGKLVQIDISSGTPRWTAPLGSAKQSSGGAGCAATPPSVAIYGSPAIAGDLVYVGSYIQEGYRSRGKIYAFNFGRDEPRWVYPRDGFFDGPIVGGIAVSKGKVYFGGSDGKVYVLDAAEGHKLGEFQTGGIIWSTPTVDGDTVYIGSFDKKLYALDAVTLTPTRWKEFETEGAIAATPLVYKNTAYIGSFDRYLYAIDTADGSLKWKSPAKSWFWAHPLAYNNTIYAPSLDGKVYILNAETGAEEIPPIDLGSPISSSPILVDGKVIIASEEGSIYSLNTTDKQIRKIKDLKEKVNAPLSANEGIVYIHTAKDVLYGLDADTAAIRQFYLK